MRKTSSALAAFASLLTLAWVLPPDSRVARAQAPTSPPEFPASVELITIDAVATDAEGRSVAGLGKDDFVVEEDGQRQEIVSFEAVSVPEEPGPAAPSPEAFRVATNAGTGRRSGRAFAILADDLRLPGEQSLQIRHTIDRFLAESLAPGDTVILGTTSGDVWWSAQMPDGRADLLAVMGRVQGRYVDPSIRDHMTEYEAFWITHREAGSPPRQALAGASIAEQVGNPFKVYERVVLRFWELGLCGVKGQFNSVDSCWPMVRSAASDLDGARSRRTTLTLRALARAVGLFEGRSGRNSIVFVSPGFLQDDDLSPRDLERAALRAHAAIYFVDARGLVADYGPGPAARPEPADPSGVTVRHMEEQVLASAGAQSLADDTGGFSVQNTNDLAGAMGRIAAESRVFYLLGFHPPPGKGANAWRKVRVTVTRPGVTTRARRGYRLDASSTAGQRGKDEPISLRLASYVLEPLATGRTRVLAVTDIEIPALRGPAKADVSSPPLKMRLEATPRDGKDAVIQDVSLESSRPISSEGPPPEPVWRTARLDVELPAGVHRLRAFVSDPATGRSGAVEQRIFVPEPGAFHVSTPVVSDQAASAGPDSSPSPVPVARDEFMQRPDRPLLAMFEVFGAAKDPASGHYDVASRIVLEDRGGRPLAAPPAAPLAPSPGGLLRQVLALPPLPAGDYGLLIAIEDRVAGSRQEVRTTFTVEGPPKAPAREAAAAAAAPAATPPATGELAVILDRAAQYVLTYGKAFSSILAEEECRQSYQADDPAKRAVRNTRAGVFFVTIPGPLPWATFRDVWEVDGNPIRDRQERLARLFKESPATASDRARAILEESGRYNLGPVRRTVNIPTLALFFLDPENQGRFVFELKGKRMVQGVEAAEVAFVERARPTLVVGETSAGAPVKGRVWIDLQRGAVLKTDADYDLDPRDSDHRSRARVVTEYKREPALNILVPDQMKESYQLLAALTPKSSVLNNQRAVAHDERDDSGVVTIEATTRYSGYHRFEVTTEENYTLPPKLP